MYLAKKRFVIIFESINSASKKKSITLYKVMLFFSIFIRLAYGIKVFGIGLSVASPN